MSLAVKEPSSRALRTDGRREVIIPLDVRGRFIRARRVVFAALMVVYGAIPFVIIGGHPGVHLDVPTRRFFLLGGSFNAQDVWMLALLAIAFLFTLLFVTTWRGRLWCGWACPQTVFLEALFRPIERLFEGSRSRRLREDPHTPARMARTAGKHLTFVGLSLGLGHAALIPFVPLGTMPDLFRDGPGAHPVAFAWAIALSALVYFDFAWFREQLCIVLCPYGRLQSVLHDGNSIVIGYDARRGEPRGPLKRAAGACVDCNKCVGVCPTGIDIRNGFQMECIACAQCIDACDEVMDKIKRPRGLIRYASMNELEGTPTRVLRPRLLIYGALAFVAAAAFAGALLLRTPFEANVIRPVGVPWVIEGDWARNQLELHLVNKRSDQRSYRIRLEPSADVRARFGQTELTLGSLGHARVPVVLIGARTTAAVTLVVGEVESGVERRTRVQFLAPR